MLVKREYPSSETLLKYLEPYSLEEETYKLYHDLKGDTPEGAASFRNELVRHPDLLPIVEKGLNLPGIVSGVFDYLTEENTFLYPADNIVIAKHFRYTPLFRHAHSFIEIPYLLSGACVNIIDGNVIPMLPGDLHIIAPDIYHTIETKDDSVLVNILVRKSTFNEIFSRLLEGNNILSDFFNKILYAKNFSNYITFSMHNDIQLKTALEYLIWEGIFSDMYSYSLKESLLMTIFIYMVRNHTDKIKISAALKEKEGDLMNIFSYLQNNFATATLESTAERYSYSPAHFSRKVKQMTGKSFSDLLREVKIRKACSLLTATKLSVEEISGRAGYSTPEQFYRMFKKTHGMTPAEYRKKQKKMAMIVKFG